MISAIVHSLSHQTGKTVVDSTNSLMEGVTVEESISTPAGETYNLTTLHVGNTIHVVSYSLLQSSING